MDQKNILCFGDSNTHGYNSKTGGRFTVEERWTKLLQRKLGDDYYVIEEGLSGRTTSFEDPVFEGLSGLNAIYPCMMTHEPLDLVIIMLGTNDTKDRLIALCRLAFITILFSSLGTAQAAFLFKNMMVKQQAKASITAVLLSSSVGVLMAWNGFAYWSLATQGVVYVGLNTLLVWHYSTWRPSLKIDFTPVKTMFPFSFKIAATTIATKINDNVMNILLGRFYNNAITGSYNQAYQWNSKCYLLLQGMLNPVIQPTLVNLSDDKERQLMAFRKMVRFICFLSFPLLFGLGLVSNEFIIITLTEKWQSSAELLRMLCVGGSVMPLYTLFSNVVISKGKSGAYFLCTVSLSITQIVLMLFLWPYGIRLMVSVYVALTIIWMFVWYALAYRYICYRPLDFLKDTCPFLLAALGVMSLTYLATMSIPNLVCLLLARVVMAAVLYFVVMKVARVAILDECIRFVLKKK